MKKVICVFGTRPEAIKMCPLVKELDKRKNIKNTVCITGQHKEMLENVLKDFGVKPKYNLEIMKESQTLFDITSKVLCEMKSVLEKEKPNFLLVHGDTTTAFASALAGFYMGIPVCHIEAGLRTYDVKSPFPEEFNRQAVGLVSDYHFAPTKRAKENLLKEGKSESKIFVTGNTGIDALQTTVKENYRHPIVDKIGKNEKMVILTCHRRENIGEPMKNIFKAVNRILKEYENVKIVYPLHLNPKVRKIAEEELIKSSNLLITEPLDVLDFHNFLSKSYLVLTDSGGVQEEANALSKPVLVLRDTSERQEGISSGALRLVGSEEENIYKNCKLLLENQTEYEKMRSAKNPYGDGHASERIADILEKL